MFLREMLKISTICLFSCRPYLHTVYSVLRRGTKGNFSDKKLNEKCLFLFLVATGTMGSIWINETVDLEIGNETDVLACARNSTSCCSASWDIRIKKCQEMNGNVFNVYRLRQPPSCPMAYCAGSLK